MKVKHVMSIFALSALMGLGAFAGASLARKPLEARADDPNTWGFGVVLDASSIPDSYRSECSNFRFHAWGTNVDEFFEMHSIGVDDVYSVNVSFKDTQAVSYGQFVFDQNGEDKYSQNASFGYSKDSDFFGYMSWKFYDSWSDGKWATTGQKWSRAQISYYDTELASHSEEMDYDPVKRCFHFDNLVIISTNQFRPIELLIGGTWDYTYQAIYNYSETFSGGGAWFEIKWEGTYDIFINNEFKYESEPSGGIIEIKDHFGPTNTYIYYVLENNTPTNDYIYTWGGSEQFGAWPGTKVTEVAGYQEVTGNGVLHFQGSETPKLIYKIPVTIGYPSGDEQFKLNNGKNQDQEGYWASEERPLNSRSAYWHTGAANGNAAAAIDFLVEAERIRNLAADTSVCNISKSNAETLVNTYNSLGTDIQETYVDCSKVFTHKKDKTEGNELVSYHDVMLELSRIAGVALNGVKPLSVFNANNGALLVVVISAGITVIGAATLLTLKKRKHQ